MKRLLAYLAAALVVADAARAGYLATLASAPAGADDVTVAATLGAGLLLGLPSVALGVLVATRRPDNVVGLVLVIVGAVPIDFAASSLYNAAVAGGVALPVSALYEQLMVGSWMLFYVPPALLFLLVPDGRLPGPRWRWVVGGLLVTPVAFSVAAAFDPAPLPEPYADLPKAFRASEGVTTVILGAGAALLPVFLGLLVASFAAVRVRYRRTADPVVRAQLKWFALGASFVPLTLLLCWAGYLILGRPDVVLIGLAATYLAIPAATAVGVLRHDLYDVDRALSTTVTYAAATSLLLAFYTAASFLVGVGAGGTSPLAAAAATAICAAALAPLRGRLQRAVDRRLYPARPAALTALAELRRGTDAGDAQPEQLEAALRTALRDQSLRVGYLLPGSTTMVDVGSRPVEPGPADTAAPVHLAGQVIGVITSAGPVSRELLREVAEASALVVEVVRLRAEVTYALGAVEASRSRLLVAGYEERRRLERDLHDGAQQRLVSLGLSLRLAQRHLGEGTVDVDGVLDRAVAELGAAVAELRHIAHGLRPSSLDDGLDRALGALVSTVPVPVTLDVSAGALPSDLATTAYYVASEALANAVKHASPATIGVRISHDGQQVTVTVRDDGEGGAVVRPGTGLAGLADRVAAAGGRLQLSSPRGGGTTVEAVLPCAS